MATSTGPSSSDRVVPRSPLVLASASIQSSPLYNFAVPSTPVQDTLKFPLSRAASTSVVSPLVQTVPIFGEQEPVWERLLSFKSGPKPSLETARRKQSRGAKDSVFESDK